MAGRFAFTVEAKTENIPVIADGLEAYLTDVGVDDTVVPDIQLAVDEAVTNIIMHGYRGGAGTIAVSCEVGTGCVRVAIRDRAPAFNPLSVPAPDLTADLESRVVGGMGIWFIRKVMDSVSYEYTDGENVLMMEKRV